MLEEPVARVAWRHYQDWVLPPRVVRVILTLALFCVFLGMILVSIGGGLHITSLLVAGGVLAGVGACGLLVCLLMCMHACFVFRVRDQAVQTEASLWDEEETSMSHPTTTTTAAIATAIANNTGHTLTLPPSALKPSDSTLRRQPTTGAGGGEGGEWGGREPKKSVTYSGEVQCYSPPSSPALSSTSLLSSVFNSPAGTLEREGGGGPHHGYPHHPSLPPPPLESQSLPRNVCLQQLIEDLDYDVPVERTPMLTSLQPPSAASSAVRMAVASGSRQGRPFASSAAAAARAPEGTAFDVTVADRGRVKGAGGLEIGFVPTAPSFLHVPRNRHGTMETDSSSKTSDYDNI